MKVSLGFEPRFTDIIQEILNRYPLSTILILQAKLATLCMLLLLLSATRFSSFHLSTSPWRRRRRQPPRESSGECTVLVFECLESEHRKADGFRSFALQTTATPRRQRRLRLRLRLRRLTSSTASASRPRGAFLILLILFISFVPAFCLFLYLCPRVLYLAT